MDYLYIEEWIKNQPFLNMYWELVSDISKVIASMSQEQKIQYLGLV